MAPFNAALANDKFAIVASLVLRACTIIYIASEIV
jgi:hypothetical protein